MIDIDLGKGVNYSDLEKAILNAGKEVGWNVFIEDQYDKKYSLNNDELLVKTYDYTLIFLTDFSEEVFSIFPCAALTLHIPDKETRDRIYILDTYLLMNYASERKVQDYLKTLQKHLNSN